MNISVMGSGAWGTALALLLKDNGNEVTLYSAFESEANLLNSTRENPYLKGITIHEDIYITSDMNDTKNAEAVILATPSFAVRSTAKALKGILKPDTLIVIVSKGIEVDSTKNFCQVIEEELDTKRIAVLSGPSHAEEVAMRLPTACVAASFDIHVAEQVQDIFMNDNFRVYSSTDVIGVSLGGALKNIIALCTGVCDGLGYGDNTSAMLMTRGLSEMAALGVSLGGKRETFAGLAGVGDLIVTCTSLHSRNRSAGVLIGKGMTAEDAMKEVGATVEGYYAAKVAMELSEKTGVEMPISSETYKVLYEGKDPKQVVGELMTRSKKHEMEGVSFIK